MSHRAADTADEAPPPPPTPRRALFQERFLPHYGIAAIIALYGVFYAVVGAAAVPQTITLGFTGTIATWFGYLIQQGGRKDKGDT